MRGATARTVVFDEEGGPDVLRLVRLPLAPPAAGQVRVRIEAIGLNRGEALLRSGGYWYRATLPQARLGSEAAGVVEAVGPEVRGFAPGDAVSILATGIDMSVSGLYADRVNVAARTLFHRPEPVDAVTGAAVWMSYLTAYGALVEVGQVQPGEEVVITAASSSVGLAAIQIANQLGAVPIAVTRTPAKAERLRAAGAAHVLSMTDGDIAAQVRELTGGRGGRLIFDCVAGPGFAALARAAAPRGMVIVYGWLDPRPAPLPMNWPLHIVGYGLPFVTDDPAALQRAESYIRAGLQSGALTPTIDSTFDLADIAAAHRRLETGDQLGKIVVTVAHPRHREGPEMTTTPADLVHRFMDAINDTDPIRRRTTIHDICTPDIAYTDPDDHVEGPDALDALFARLQARIPGGFRFALTGAIDSHHQQARFAWAFGPVDSRAVATGSDVVAFANGRIHRVYSFFDPAAD